MILFLLFHSFFSIESKITLSMCVKNEADRYLRNVLQSVKECIDEAVIIDDASTDNTVAICQEELKNISLKIIQNKESKFVNEVNLRKQQWDETIKTNPDWILCLDADEMPEKKFTQSIKSIINKIDDKAYVLYFRLYDFWDENNYREDNYWCAHKFYRPFLVKYIKDFNYLWIETPQHCGRFPYNIMTLPGLKFNFRIKHFGWAKQEDRIKKYWRYKKLDPDAQYGWKEQYESILDEAPNLIPWYE